MHGEQGMGQSAQAGQGREAARPEPPAAGVCGDCGGMVEPVWRAAMLGGEIPGEHIVSNLCERCTARRFRRAEAAANPAGDARSLAGLPVEAQGWDFAAAEAGARGFKSEADLKAWQATLDALNYWHGKGVFFLWGDGGLGKSVLGYAWLAEALADGKRAYCLAAPELVAAMKQSRAADSPAWGLVERAKNADDLLIDNLPGGRWPKALYDALLELLYSRCRQKKATLITATCPPGEIVPQRWDKSHSLEQRLCSGEVVEMVGVAFGKLGGGA